MSEDHGPRPVYSAHVPSHDHVPDDAALGELEANPIWQQDNVTLHSVGMDIGSSGTQVVFSACTCGASARTSPAATWSCGARPSTAPPSP